MPEPNPQPSPQVPVAEGVKPSLRLVLRGTPETPPASVSLRLARNLGLAAWGDYLLGPRVAQEMGAAGMILMVVLLFELLAWSLLFNVLANAAQWGVTWRTPCAALLGAAFATGIFLFERSFITADFHENRLKKTLAYGLRLGIIFGSCIATSQPLELLVFGGAVNTRLRDENALAQAVRLVEDRKELGTASAAVSEGALEASLAGSYTVKQRDADSKALESAASDARELTEKLAAAQQLISRRQGEVTERNRRVGDLAAQLRRETDSDQRSLLDERLGRARSALAASRARLEEARQEKSAVEDQLNHANALLAVVQARANASSVGYRQALAQKRTAMGAATAAAKADLAELKGWMHQVQSVVPGKSVRRAKTGFVLPPKAADFTDRLRVIEDLKAGIQPNWPSADPTFVAEAATQFGLEAPGAKLDPSLQHRRQQDAELFSRIYRIAFVIAAVIPLLTLAFKLMMSQELATYYSVESQARAGNPDAISSLHARGVDLEQLARPLPVRWWRPAGQRLPLGGPES